MKEKQEYGGKKENVRQVISSDRIKNKIAKEGKRREEAMCSMTAQSHASKLYRTQCQLHQTALSLIVTATFALIAYLINRIFFQFV